MDAEPDDDAGLIERSTASTATWLGATRSPSVARRLLRASPSSVRVTRPRTPGTDRSDRRTSIRPTASTSGQRRLTRDALQGRRDLPLVLQVALLQRPRRAESHGQASAAEASAPGRRTVPCALGLGCSSVVRLLRDVARAPPSSDARVLRVAARCGVATSSQASRPRARMDHLPREGRQGDRQAHPPRVPRDRSRGDRPRHHR